jgi:uncharacterized protein YodC (DUF2158 family)
MPAASTIDLELGAVVELNSGGPPMTVREISGSVIHCEWFKDATLKKASFERHSLRLAAKSKTHEERLNELARLEEMGQL